jgi:hypothetical protein
MDGKAMTRQPPKVRMTTREEADKRYQDKSKGKGSVGLGPLAGEPSKA